MIRAAPEQAANARSRWALVAAVGLLVVANVVRSTLVAGRYHFAFNVSVGAAAGLLAVWAAMSADELGLSRSTVRAGLRWGLGSFAAISIPVVFVAIIPTTRSLLDDGRTDVSVGSMLVRALIVIPVGTVLVEELAFRGVLLGLLERVASAGRALVASAVLFGLWHLLPVWRGGGAGDLGGADGSGRFGAVAVTFLATTVAGLGFGWLRQRSGSLIAPIAAHIATNSVVFAAAWAVAR